MPPTCIFCFFLLSILFSFGNSHERIPQISKRIVDQTEHWAVKLVDGIHGPSLGEKFGVEHVTEHDNHKNVHLFKSSGNLTDLLESDHVVWKEKQEPKWRFKRISPHDPLFGSQWHLHNTPGKDLNVLEAWNRGYTGKGVTIAVVDDGLQSTHPDFQGNYRSDVSWDFNSRDSNPEPYSYDSHGTEAAGAAAAGINSICGVGTAPEASLAGIRLIGDAVDDFTEAAGLGYKPNEIDIYTCSWGPQDDARRLEAPGTLTGLTIENCIENGRNGKGTIYAWAGGNGRRSNDNCNYDGYANSRYTISIGAFDFTGVQAWYSEDCAMLLAVTPSSGGSRNIYTTDLKGRSGASYDDCASTFGGTSAASPMAAGIMALALQARPDLTWRDVQGVLIHSAVKVDPNDSGWFVNAAGLSVNHKYGFGRLDAVATVDAALSWSLLPPYYSTSCSNGMTFSLSSTPTRVPCEITDLDMIIEHVEIQTEVASSYRGRVQIDVISPSRTTSSLAKSRSDSSRNISFDWKWGTLRTYGEKAAGTWILSISSSNSSDRLQKMRITIYGHK